VTTTTRISDEQVKLTATLLNNLAAASILLGFIAPLVTQDEKILLHTLPYGAFAGIAFHLLGRFCLRFLS
jgi:hypothetical protein